MNIRKYTNNLFENLPRMFDDRIKSNKISRIYLFSGLTLLSSVYYYAFSTVIVDDAYIYFRSVENFYEFGDSSFNIGESRNLLTSPGWFILLSAAKFSFPDFPLPAVARLLSMIFLSISSVLLFNIFENTAPKLSAYSAIPVFFAPSIPDLAGHDTALALCMNLLLILAFLRRQRIIFPVAAGLAYMARGEAAIMAALLGTAYVLSEGISYNAIRRNVRELLPGLSIAAAIVGLWHWYHLYAFQSLFPDTLSAKIQQTASHSFTAFRVRSGYHLRAVTEPFGLAPHIATVFGLVLLWRRAWPLAAWPFVHYATYTALNVPWYTWYYYPVEFAAVLGIVVAISFVSFRIGATLPARYSTVGSQLALALGIFLAVGPIRHATVNVVSLLSDKPRAEFEAGRLFGADERYVFYKDFAAWVRTTHRGPKPPSILTHEIGIIGYFAPEAKIYDVVGLATPIESLTEMWNYEYQIEKNIPDFVMRIYISDPPPSFIVVSQSGRSIQYSLGLARKYPGTTTHVAIYHLKSAREAGKSITDRVSQ